MEQPHYGDTPNTNSSKEGVDDSDERAGFVASWMQRLRGESSEEEKSDKPEKDSKKKSKKFGRYILGKLGISKHGSESEKSDDQEQNKGLFANGLFANKPEAATPDAIDNNTVLTEASQQAPETQSEDLADVESTPLLSQGQEEAPVDMPDNDPIITRADRDIDVRQEIAQQETEQEHHYQAANVAPAEAIDRAPEAGIERTPDSQQEKESKPERLAAAATVLLGAEHIGRKRADKRLKREIKDLQEQVQIIEKGADNLKRDSAKHYEQAKANTYDLEQRVEDKARIQEVKQHHAVEEGKDTAMRRADKMESVMQGSLKNPKTDSLERSKKVDSEVEMSRRQEFVQEKKQSMYEKAMAEYGDIKESKLTETEIERKHEVKDDPSIAPPLDPGLRSIGSILESLNDPLAAQTKSSNPTGHSTRQNDVGITKPSDSPMYKQAIWGGFWFAIVAIITVILLVLAS